MLFKKILMVLAAIIGAHFALNGVETNTVQLTQIEAPLSPADPSILPPLPSSEEMTTSYEGAFIRMLVTLLGLIALVFGTLWVLRRLGRGKLNFGTSGRSIQILEKRPLSPKSMLYLVEIGNKQVLITESQLEVRCLTQMEVPAEED